METKAFDQKLLDKYDKVAREELKVILNDIIHSDEIDRYEVNYGEINKTFEDGCWDLKLVLKNGKSYKLEAEEKDASQWGWGKGRRRAYPFRFNTMHIPFRKKTNSADYFFVISMAHDFAFCVRRKMAHMAPVITINTYLQKNDGFFDIPVTWGFFLEKKGGKWEKVEN